MRRSLLCHLVLAAIVTLFSRLAIADAFLEKLRREAIEVLKKAQAVRPNKHYEKTLEALGSIELILVAKNHPKYALCVELDAHAVQDRGEPVYYCTHSHRNYIGSWPKSYQMRNLIHEAAHAAGYWNECDAEKIAISAIGDARLPPSAKSGHAVECKLDSSFRINAPEKKAELPEKLELAIPKSIKAIT